MSAGLPGFGLGGIFFIFSALIAVPRELGRTLQGRSSLAAWRTVGRQFAQAAAMVAVVLLVLRAPLLPIGVTVAVLVVLLTVAKLAAALVGRRRRFARIIGRDGISDPRRSRRLLAAFESDGDR